MQRKHLIMAVALLLSPALLYAATQEVLVGTDPTRIPRTSGTVAVMLYNSGPQAICCAQAVDAGYPNCVPIPPGAALSLDVATNQPITCVAPTAQTLDGGTRVLEVY